MLYGLIPSISSSSEGIVTKPGVDIAANIHVHKFKIRFVSEQKQGVMFGKF